MSLLKPGNRDINHAYHTFLVFTLFRINPYGVRVIQELETRNCPRIWGSESLGKLNRVCGRLQRRILGFFWR